MICYAIVSLNSPRSDAPTFGLLDTEYLSVWRHDLQLNLKNTSGGDGDDDDDDCSVLKDVSRGGIIYILPISVTC